MKYETPELTQLAPAINAAQQTVSTKGVTGKVESIVGQNTNETTLAYQDWE